jgi:dTMP kinase
MSDLATQDVSGSSRGAFIVLEGLDRSGKTTQVKLLEQRFVEEGKKVKVMRFPDRTTPIGQMIDNYLKSNVEMEDHVIHLLFSANRWEAV